MTKSKIPRIIYNDDTCGLRLVEPPHSENQLSTVVEYLKGSQVDCVCWAFGCPPVAASYYSHIHDNLFDLVEKATDYSLLGKSIERNLMRSMHKSGVDYLPILIDKYHAVNIDFYASFRMNDSHHKARPQDSTTPEFWKKHQHYRLWEVTDTLNYHNVTLDYAYPEVRQLKLDAVTEVVNRYDVDGIELDFCRDPYVFQPSEAWNNRDILTNFISLIHKTITAVASDRGKSISLIIRVPFSNRLLKQAGMDVETWLELGCLDILVMSPLANKYNQSLKPWRELCKKHNVLFYPSVEYNPQINCTPSVNQLCPGVAAPQIKWLPQTSQETIERTRGMAQNYLAQKPDGLYIFNYPCRLFETHPSPTEFVKMASVLQEVGSLDTLKDKAKEYLFWCELPIIIEAMRPPHYHQTINFNINDGNLDKTNSVTLRFRKSIENNPHNLVKSKSSLPDNYINTILNGKILDERMFKKTKENSGEIPSGFNIGKHEKIEIKLSGADIVYGENTLAFEIPHFPQNDSPYVYIYELCVRISS